MHRLDKIRVIAKRLAQSARLMIGVHDYDAYVAHCQSHHPDMPILSREKFFRACQEARYNRINRCPC